MKKRIIVILALLFVCSFFDMARSEAGQTEIIDRDGFYIVDGTLVRYTGELAPGKEIVLPQEVKMIGKEAFSVSNYLNYSEDMPKEWETYYMKLVIPKGVKLDDNAFRFCISLDIYFGEGIITLDSSAKTDSRCRCKVHFPKTLREVKDFAFSGCIETRIYFNDGLKTIGGSSFEFVTVDNVLPKSLKVIGDKAFMGARFVDRKTVFADDDSLLKVPMLPKGLKRIGAQGLNARKNSKSAKKQFVKIPASVKDIGPEAFGENGTPAYLYKVDKNNKYYWSDKNGWLYSKDKKTLYYAAVDYEHNVIPDYVRNIEFLSLYTALDSDYKEREILKIYFPKKLEKVTRYPGCLYHCAFIFRGDKAPALMKYKGDNAVDYKRDKWLYDKENYFVVKKGLKSKLIKNLKLGNYPESRIKERQA